ncbi:GNAT family N-acetyltransferase [Streptomyces sp. WAC05374]|uniref:GNAT family N-acetyltransferase n=1 Tax=Streptomyces sp. WAC05374 TaxID=2487420 RepID=UPI000F89C16D|nr:GNAT family N-acetyltransferase [Streptomyces sp. WAC05374]RST10275.1 GNAT family N-acetyltransferase [Streptomyces sp. WAC05374]TDF50319.1 GNAT family N-acetyltransferase [Streptomyces sp. WAC05374]TDF58043.1 GNAT family N-acetyltransferase [Streptomyces sp. WAC05374]TDF60571.1 GNAT family N-acetyltransferase [Streptomyces sp. WAC05374]
MQTGPIPTVRAARMEDAPHICELLNTIDTIEIGAPETDLHSVEADLTHPEADLAQDSWLAFEDGRLVAYALVWCESGGERVDMDHYVLPGHQAAGERLLEAAEERCRSVARGNGATRAVVHLHLNQRPTTDTAILTRRGWRTVRRYQVMVRDLTPHQEPLPEPPPGVTLSACTDEAGRRRAHALVQETFAEHFDHQPRTYEQWLDDIDAARLDWSLVWVAAVEGAGDAAVLVSRNDRSGMGWIGRLGVVKDMRGRGLGGHLLRHAFAVYAGLGRDTLGLGVDTLNESGALRLYEAHGMRLHYAVDTWEVTLPAGT